MNPFQRYLLDEFVEDYRTGEMSRRDFVMTVIGVSGGLAPALGFYGELDTGITSSAATVQAALAAAGVPHDFKVYAGANHAFFNDTGPRYDKAAATDARMRAVAWLREIRPLASLAALVGPTGVGKTALALALAEHLPLEVVSADSRAVYRWMDIGTAKPSPEERRRVPHHLIDVVDPDEPYSLSLYQQQALAAVGRIIGRGRTPLLVGGAGLYVSAVCDGLAMPDVAPDAAFRAAMEERARLEGWQALAADLQRIDPLSAGRIDPKNVRRVIRALEVHHVTGRPFSAWQTPVAPAFGCVLIGLNLERQALFARLDRRIDAWIAGGVVEEVRGLLDRGYAPSLPSMSGIGYREIAQVVGGELDLATAVAHIKQATHQYAKRQMTWFRRDTRIVWLDAASVTTEQVLRTLEP